MQTLSPFITLMIAYPSIPLSVALVILLLYTAYLHHKIYRFTRGSSGASLESLMHSAVEGIQKIEERNELISKHALDLNTKVSHSLRNIQTIRYKAFETNGSNQSFSVALLNERGNGVIISSLHAHERISTFAKPVEKYKSTYELTDEEAHVIEEAKKAHVLEEN